ncbi:MAG: hypothetical protein RSA48_02615 [Bacilli bacterium]
MLKVLNKIFYILKLFLLLISFGFTFYIIVFMYKRLDKNLIQSVSVFLPYVILFLLFAINMILDQKVVKDNLFYNMTSCLVFCLFIFVGYRAIFDPNMIATIRLGYNINFNYYSDMISPLQIMLYGLSISNVLLFISGLKEKAPKKKNVSVNDKSNILPKEVKEIPEDASF